MRTTSLVLSFLLLYPLEQCKAADSVKSSIDRDGQSDGLELVGEKTVVGGSVKQAPKGRIHTSSDIFGSLTKNNFEEKRILRVWNKFILRMIRRK